ncbi:MAG: iron-sulfur cluster repair di-iron protein [Bacteroidia bacterium]|nr:iron-sulfur cluster repair di-iron protein [Bacteroidia bacterium]MBP7260319.1 iron-sulfur cluster repair di-iron protein [Bacteroidia bacterium]MBP9179655.1 iron-sulfur cluster repair di-iron protein [Bacteroidia bacterium]MBP9723951.1 iron-sulfur cluster repair di-iron protein [Bacteroidia bacterium]
MNTLVLKKVGELVAEDYRTAAVFQSNGIDFCCKGNRTIAEACATAQKDEAQLLVQLESVLNAPGNTAMDYASWPADLLVDYIEKKHHRYVVERTPVLLQYLDKLCKVHGKTHPELFDVFQQFTASASELAAHMKKEELVLFPYLRKIAEAINKGENIEKPHFGTVENPVAMMMQEHEVEGERFRTMAVLTDDYTPPADACNTYRVTYALLKEFEEDLHLHIHLENNILFPWGIEQEKLLATAS